MMNLETKVQNNMNVSNCMWIYSFEDKVLIKIYENGKYTYKLFKLKEGELGLLDEKTDRDEWYYGSGNLGILASFKNKMINFSTIKLWFSENKVEDRKLFYNSLVGPTEFPEFAEDIC